MGDEITNVANSVSTNVHTNFANTVLINSNDKKGRHKMDCYILHSVLFVIILLYTIAITCYHYVNTIQNKNVLAH